MTEVIETAALAERLLESVGSIRRRTRQAVGRPWAAGRISLAQGEVLRHVRRHPGASIKDTAAKLGLAANTVSTLVRELVQRELLERTPSPADNRVASLALTDRSREPLEAWRNRRLDTIATILAELTEKQRGDLAAGIVVMELIAERLDERSRHELRTEDAR